MVGDSFAEAVLTSHRTILTGSQAWLPLAPERRVQLCPAQAARQTCDAKSRGLCRGGSEPLRQRQITAPRQRDLSLPAGPKGSRVRRGGEINTLQERG